MVESVFPNFCLWKKSLTCMGVGFDKDCGYHNAVYDIKILYHSCAYSKITIDIFLTNIPISIFFST